MNRQFSSVIHFIISIIYHESEFIKDLRIQRMMIKCKKLVKLEKFSYNEIILLFLFTVHCTKWRLREEEEKNS